MKNLKPSETTYQLKDGTEVNMSITMAQLYRLKTKDKKTYEAVNSLLLKGPTDLMEIAQLLYGAYLCANLKEPNNYGFEDFLDYMQEDLIVNAEYIEKLFKPKKK